MVERILIVKFWALGDILMATPILPALKSLFPASEISWLVDTAYAGALDGNPYVDRIIPFDSGAWRRDYRYGRFRRYLTTSMQMRRMLQQHSYNLTISLTAEKWWTLWFLTGSLSVGLFPGSKAGVLGRFYTHSVVADPSNVRHSTDHYLEAVKALGLRSVPDRRIIYKVAPQHRETANDFLAALPNFDRHRPIVLLHPGTSQTTKSWPLEAYAALVDRLGPTISVVVTGSPAEEPMATALKDLVKSPRSVAVAAGRLPQLGQTAALMELATAVVTGDTSTLHVASALNVPVVAIYGSTRPGVNAPLSGRHRLLFNDSVDCAPCWRARCPLAGNAHLQCLTTVSAQQVSDSIMQLLSADGQSGSVDVPAKTHALRTVDTNNATHPDR